VKSERLAQRLLLLTAVTQFVAWAPITGMPTWLDEKYTLMSVATLIVFIAIAWEFFTQRRLSAGRRPRDCLCLRRARRGIGRAGKNRTRRARPQSTPSPAAVVTSK
jgi:hypothetical protein